MSENQNQYALTVRDEVLYPTWQGMKDQATVLHKSHFFPKSIKSPEQALAIMMAGRELDIGPMESLRSIYIVDGQTTVSSGLMAAMIWQAGHSYVIEESTDKLCRIKFTRSTGQTYTHEFTHDDAAKAGLLKGMAWQKYEKAMLFNRCISAGSRAIMPDVFRKLYTPDEVGAPVMVSESGDVVIDVQAIDVTPQPAPQPEEPQPAEHWTVTQDWAKFWTYWKGERGLTEAQVHEAAGVESMKAYAGSKEDLQAAVETWLEARIEQDQSDLFGNQG